MKLYSENEKAFTFFHLNYAAGLLSYLMSTQTYVLMSMASCPPACEYFPSGCLDGATLLETSAQIQNRHSSIEELQQHTEVSLFFLNVFTNCFHSSTWECWRRNLMNPLPDIHALTSMLKMQIACASVLNVSSQKCSIVIQNISSKRKISLTMTQQQCNCHILFLASKAKNNNNNNNINNKNKHYILVIDTWGLFTRCLIQ